MLFRSCRAISKPSQVLLSPGTVLSRRGTIHALNWSSPTLTITRVGSNALFRFLAGGREMTLDGGTMLFSSPEGAGGGKVQVGAITAAVTGTDF